MKPEERRALEKLAEAWEAPPWGGICKCSVCIANHEAGRTAAKQLRATLDRLTDEQSGEPATETKGDGMTPEKMDAIDDEAIKELVATYLDPSRSKEYTRLLYRVQIMERGRWLEEDDEQSGERGAELDQFFGDMAHLRAKMGAVAHGMDVLMADLGRLHHSPEPPDSTEPEDDQPLEGRVQEWLYLHVGEDIAPDTARKMLHDTGILTKESETP